MAVLIKEIKARQIIDSRANPTLSVEITLNKDIKAFSCVPSGASKGKKEALELRDEDPDYLFSKSVLKATDNVNKVIAGELIGKCPFEQYEIDTLMEKLDGSNNLSNLGANAILGVSLALAKVSAKALNLELFQYLGGLRANTLPTPMINIINGGVHSSNNLDFQEFMIVPVGAPDFSNAIRMSLEVFHKLKEIIKKRGFSTNVGDEGGFAPNIAGIEDTLELILDAIFEAGYTTDDIKLALDVAASEFYENNKYILQGENKVLTSGEMLEYLIYLKDRYPIISIEDGLAQDDFESWKKLTQKANCMLVGDDLFVTNPQLLQEGIKEKIANAILIKPNQIGTLSKTLECIELAKNSNYKTIISHRSGETEDTFIADLSVGVNSPFIKTGSLSRTDRTSKYNRLLYIESILGKYARYRGYYSIK